MSGDFPSVRIEDLGTLVRAKRRDERLTLEQAARQSGVSAATLSRLERQPPAGPHAGDRVVPIPDTRTLAVVVRWLGVSLAHVLAAEAKPQPKTGESLPDVVAAHLRADRNLDPAAAAWLAGIFRAGYQQALRAPPPAAETASPTMPPPDQSPDQDQPVGAGQGATDEPA